MCLFFFVFLFEPFGTLCAPRQGPRILPEEYLRCKQKSNGFKKACNEPNRTKPRKPSEPNQTRNPNRTPTCALVTLHYMERELKRLKSYATSPFGRSLLPARSNPYVHLPKNCAVSTSFFFGGLVTALGKATAT